MASRAISGLANCLAVGEIEILYTNLSSLSLSLFIRDDAIS
jgi:hypothetical protein